MSAPRQKIVFFDLETTGLDPKRHAILQVAAVAVDESFNDLETFEAKIRFDERRANRNSLRKTHYHRGVWVRRALDAGEAAKRFADFLRRHASVTKLGSDGEPFQLAQLVAHNAPFDTAFLQVWYERLCLFLPVRYQVFCTLQRALWYFQEHPDEMPPVDFKLATLCNYFGVPFHAANAHDAVGDVNATVALYRAMSERVRTPFEHPRQASANDARYGDGSAGMVSAAPASSLLTGSNGR